MSDETEKIEEETDHEEVVLNRWQRIKQWWEMINATYKAVRWTMMALKLTAVGTTAAVVVDEVVETTLVEDGATALGLRDEAPPVPSEISAQEFEAFIEWQRTHVHEVAEHEHPMDVHEHDLVPHEHPEAAHRHEDHIHLNHTHPEIEALRSEIRALQGASTAPAPDATSVSGEVIDDAFRRHVEEDH